MSEWIVSLDGPPTLRVDREGGAFISEESIDKIVARVTSDINADLLTALEIPFERCKTSGSFRPTLDWMKMTEAAIKQSRRRE